jgi:hypothetical protein
MRTWAVLTMSAILFGMAGPVAAYDVSYTPITSSNTLVCPANATLNGTMCYCNVGYNMSGGQCTKIVIPPPAQFEIYDDVLMTVTINDTMTCAQLGMVATLDKQMCEQYRATAADKRDQWKSIPRPLATATNGVANPWAPASQQTLYNASQAIAPLAPPPPPPAAATTSVATSTEVAKPVEAPPVPEVDPEVEKIGEALKKVLEERSKEKPAETAKTTDDAQSAQPVVANSTTTYSPPPELIELSKKLAAAEAEAAANPPPQAPESSAAQTAQAAQAVEDTEDSPGIFARIVGFFRWLF